MSERMEGTFVLDGLIEGRLPGDDEAAGRARQWAARAARNGLPFALEIDGIRFSVLGEDRPLQVADLGDDPAETVAEALRELLEALPPDVRGEAFSTLRSTEYRRGEEVQTLYVVAPGGAIDVRQRIAEAATTAPPQPLSRRDKLRMAGTGLVAAVLVFLVSSVFVDYRALFDRIVEGVTPLNAAKLSVDAQRFARWLTVVEKTADAGGRGVVLKLKRTSEFPVTDADLRARLRACRDDPHQRLALEAVARGYVRCELFDKKGGFLGFAMVRIAPLRAAETLDLPVPFPSRGPRPARVVLTY